MCCQKLVAILLAIARECEVETSIVHERRRERRLKKKNRGVLFFCFGWESRMGWDGLFMRGRKRTYKFSSSKIENASVCINVHREWESERLFCQVCARRDISVSPPSGVMRYAYMCSCKRDGMFAVHRCAFTSMLHAYGTSPQFQ